MEPYISVIIHSRNDNYQGGGFSRMQVAVNHFIGQAKKYNLNAELIIIDWNPPQDKPLLQEALALPRDIGSLTIRFIVVPPKIHASYHASTKINLIGAAAWNVGIRRARGKFILATNADIVLSDELVYFLSREQLQEDHFYRAIRYELPKGIVTNAMLEEALRGPVKDVPAPVLGGQLSPHGLAGRPVIQTFFGTDFLVFTKKHWQLVHGHPELNSMGITADELLCYAVYLSGLKEEIVTGSLRIYHINHDSRWHTLNQSKAYRLVNASIFQKFKPDHPFRSAARNAYRSLSSVKTFFLEIYFDLFGQWMRIHVSPEKLDWNMDYIGWKYKKVLKGMLTGKRPYWYNGDNWGFPREHFQEFVINK